MTEAKKRKVHSAEFKAKVGLEAVRGVKTVNEIAQLHGVQPVMVSQWKKEILANAGTLFEGKRGPKVELEHESEDHHYGEIGRLKMELDWLKKSQAYKQLGTAGMDRAREQAVAAAQVRTGRCVAGDGVSAVCRRAT